MADLDTTEMQRFAEDVSALCQVVSDGIEGTADNASVKDRLLKLKDKADDIAAGINFHPVTKQPKYALVNVKQLNEVLS